MDQTVLDVMRRQYAPLDSFSDSSSDSDDFQARLIRRVSLCSDKVLKSRLKSPALHDAFRITFDKTLLLKTARASFSAFDAMSDSGRKLECLQYLLELSLMGRECHSAARPS